MNFNHVIGTGKLEEVELKEKPLPDLDDTLVSAKVATFSWQISIMAKAKKAQHRPQQKSKDKKAIRPHNGKAAKIGKKNKNTAVSKGEPRDR